MQVTITFGEVVHNTRYLRNGQLPPHCADRQHGVWACADPLDVTIRDRSLEWSLEWFQLGAVDQDERTYTVAGRLDPRLIAAELSRVAHVVAVHAKLSGGVIHVSTIVTDEASDDDEMLNPVFQRELEIHNDYGAELLASVEFNVLSESLARRFALGERLY